MPDKVNPQILDSITQGQGATMTQAVVKTSGAGKAYQAVAQSMAIAVQDAADYMRNIGTITNTAIGVALAEMLATQQTEPYETVIQDATKAMTEATSNFLTIGQNAGSVLENFPSG